MNVSLDRPSDPAPIGLRWKEHHMNIWKQTDDVPDERDRLGGLISRFLRRFCGAGNTTQNLGATL
jgi:hypothetical protein